MMIEISLEQYNDMAERLAELEWRLGEAEQRWIPCSERLPRENGVYIVSLEDAVYPWATFHNGGWFMLSVDNTAREFGAYEVIAWMPLPKPYEPKTERRG